MGKNIEKKTIDIKDSDSDSDSDIPTIEQLLATKNYEKLETCIPKYAKISSDSVNNIINSNPVIDHGYYKSYDTVLIEKILEKIIDSGYVMTKENYVELAKYHQRGWRNTNKLSSVKVLKNLKIEDNDIDDWYNYFKKKDIQDFHIDAQILDKKTKENLLIILCSGENKYNIKLYLADTKIPVTEKCLKYVKSSDIKNYIKKNMTLSAEDAKIINTSEKDIELLKCKSIDEIEEYIENNDYDINAQTIILACQHNIDANIINHLLSYKINFDEKSVNEIIKSYRDNENIEKLLLFVNQYGYQFQKSNYLEMLSSQYYSVLFRGNIVKNLILDNELMERAYDTYKKYPINFEQFLENIEFLGNQNQITADNIIVLYCGIGNAEKVKKLLKDYNTKLNTKCMQYLFKKTQVSKKLVELFKEEKVVPNFDVIKQCIDISPPRREKDYLYELMLLK